jgi:hypothetical protein
MQLMSAALWALGIFLSGCASNPDVDDYDSRVDIPPRRFTIFLVTAVSTRVYLFFLTARRMAQNPGLMSGVYMT